MKLFSFVLISLFALVGAHVPKAFSLFYLAMLMSWLMSRQLDQRPLPPLPMDRSRLLRTVQVLVLLFSCTYPLAMLHFGFWQLSGRQLLDVVSAAVLPSALLRWGAYWGRWDMRLFIACLLSYSFGGLVFLVAALLKTRGLSWFGPQLDPGSLLMAWGSESSMNVRSIEQNGILVLVLAPFALVLLSQKRYWIGWLVLLFALVGFFAVLPLAHGRLWVVSLGLAFWPLACSAFSTFWSLLKQNNFSRRFRILLLLITFACLFTVIWPRLFLFCDERFGMFLQAFKHWPDLIAGGRILHFQSLACWGQKSFIISLRGDPSASILSMHSVPLDVLATIGFWPALPMLSFLAIAFYAFIRFSFIWFHPFRENIHLLSQAGAHILVFWSVLAAIIPQWLFQPLIYGDALLYYLSYAMIGFLIVIGKPVKELRCA